MSINYVESKPACMDVVAPRNEQPIQLGEWAGHTSQKFGGEKSHVPHPVVDQNQPHPLYSMGGRKHYESQNQKSNSNYEWKPSMKTGIKPDNKEPRKSGIKHINFDPTKGKLAPERAHLRDKHDSLRGPTLDNPKFCMQKFEQANQGSSNEWNTEK